MILILLATGTTMGVFSETWQTIDQTTGNPRSTKTANDRPCPSTGGDSGVNSCGNLIMEILITGHILCIDVPHKSSSGRLFLQILDPILLVSWLCL